MRSMGGGTPSLGPSSLLLVFTYDSQVALFSIALLFKPTLQCPNMVYSSRILGIDSLYTSLQLSRF